MKVARARDGSAEGRHHGRMRTTRRLVLGGLVTLALVVAGVALQSSRSSHERVLVDQQQQFLRAHLETLAPRVPADHFSDRTLRSLLQFGNRFEPSAVPADVRFSRADVLESISADRKAPSEIVYGRLTTEQMGKTIRAADGSEKTVPRLDRRAVWIVMTRDVPGFSYGGPVVLKGAVKPVKPQLSYATTWVALSAKTGKMLVGQTG